MAILLSTPPLQKWISKWNKMIINDNGNDIDNINSTCKLVKIIQRSNKINNVDFLSRWTLSEDLNFVVFCFL